MADPWADGLWADQLAPLRNAAARGMVPDDQTVINVFEAMQQQRSMRPTVILRAMINACDWLGIVKVFEVMQQHGLVPDVSVYNAMISACPERAQGLFDQLQRQGLAPDAETYRLMIQLYPRRSREIFREIQQQGVVPYTITYSHLMTLAAIDGSREQALEILTHMQQHSVEMTVDIEEALRSLEPNFDRED